MQLSATRARCLHGVSTCRTSGRFKFCPRDCNHACVHDVVDVSPYRRRPWLSVTGTVKFTLLCTQREPAVAATFGSRA